jgi:hypothetical protein
MNPQNHNLTPIKSAIFPYGIVGSHFCIGVSLLKEMNHRFKDETGKKYGRLKVLKLTHTDIKGNACYDCVCDCGNVVNKTGYKLRGGTKSCGCLQKETLRNLVTTHGYTKNGATRCEYNTWCDMIRRCHNPKRGDYKYYGGIGITVCDKWRNSFVSFLEDMGKKPTPKHSIDRINNSEGYYPENCRWATRKEQANNMSTNILLTHNGETMNIAQWSERLNISWSKISRGHKKGLSINDILLLTKTK